MALTQNCILNHQEIDHKIKRIAYNCFLCYKYKYKSTTKGIYMLPFRNGNKNNLENLKSE